MLNHILLLRITTNRYMYLHEKVVRAYTKLVKYDPLPVTLDESPILIVQQKVTKIFFFVPMWQHKGEGHYSFCFIIYLLFVFKGSPMVHKTDIVNHWLNQVVNANRLGVRDAEYVH
jgi:hypothetical protein